MLINGFKHKVGKHCESSAVRDLLEFYGHPMSEAMAFGLDATIGFAYFDPRNYNDQATVDDLNFPIFVGGKADMLTPNSLACRVLGIKIHKQSFTSPKKAWDESKRLLDQGTPLIIQLDLAYLPYMRENDEEMHFGGHFVVLAGYDDDKQVAYVADTEYEGFQEVPLDKLEIARSSEHGHTFMHPHNAQFRMEPREDGKRPPFAAGVKLALKTATDHMLRASLSNTGLYGLRKFAENITNWNDMFKGSFTTSKGNEVSKARFALEVIHGSIETWGTGGACFRQLFLEFLVELMTDQRVKEGPRAWTDGDFSNLNEGANQISNSIEQWNKFTSLLRNAIDSHKDNCLEHLDLVELQDIVNTIVGFEEEAFMIISKIKL